MLGKLGRAGSLFATGCSPAVADGRMEGVRWNKTGHWLQTSEVTISSLRSLGSLLTFTFLWPRLGQQWLCVLQGIVNHLTYKFQLAFLLHRCGNQQFLSCSHRHTDVLCNKYVCMGVEKWHFQSCQLKASLGSWICFWRTRPLTLSFESRVELLILCGPSVSGL